MCGAVRITSLRRVIVVRYVRFQARYTGKHGHAVGIFGACHHLRRDGRLSSEEDRLFAEVDAWFDRELRNPEFYEDGNSVNAITWFKTSATQLIDRLLPLCDLLQRHGVEYDVVECDDPGRIIYEDEFQIGAVAGDHLLLGSLQAPPGGIAARSESFRKRPQKEE
jgi:hypothetical protein